MTRNLPSREGLAGVDPENPERKKLPATAWNRNEVFIAYLKETSRVRRSPSEMGGRERNRRDEGGTGGGAENEGRGVLDASVFIQESHAHHPLLECRQNHAATDKPKSMTKTRQILNHFPIFSKRDPMASPLRLSAMELGMTITPPLSFMLS